MKAGWEGIFAIEKDKFAFNTLKTNFLSPNSRYQYNWPEWLPRRSKSIEYLLRAYEEQLSALRGRVDLVAGGPPCQGFSSAGRRRRSDPRNRLVNSYVRLVDLINPQMVLLENVRGITYDFDNQTKPRSIANFADYLVEQLSQNFFVYHRILDAPEFGVPQSRPRFFILAFNKKVYEQRPVQDPFDYLLHTKDLELSKIGVSPFATSSDAISDLTVTKNGTIECPDTNGYRAIGYHAPLTEFQKVLRDGHEGRPSDTRLAQHRPEIAERFGKIICLSKQENRLNTTISAAVRKKFDIKKHALRVLDPNQPAPTITSMPDDLLHFDEPRTLTVRENARLQTFPDWFEFRGKYTTGGHLRREEVPRFTQVANAVPPLLAEVIGRCLLSYSEEFS